MGYPEITNGNHRYRLWLDDKDIPAAMSINAIASKVEDCRAYRQTAGQDVCRVAKTPHRFSRSTYQHQPALHMETRSETDQYLCRSFGPLDL